MIYLRTKNENGEVDCFCPKCESSFINPGAWSKMTALDFEWAVREGFSENKCAGCGENLIRDLDKIPRPMVKNGPCLR